MTTTEPAPEATVEPAPPEPTTDLAIPTPADELAALAAGAGLPAVPGWQEMQGLAAMAVTLSAASCVPVALRGRPNDVFLVLLTARELGIAPTAALRTAYVVNGLVTLAPKLRAAMVRQKGLGRIWPDKGNDREGATWHATRTDEGHAEVYSFTFTMEDARQVKEKSGTLADKYTTMGYPQRMVSWRALGYLLDDVFPEVGTGLYSADEVGATTDDEGHPVIDVRSTDPLPGTDAPRGHAGSTPPPPEPEADDETKDDLKARIARLPDEAKAALLEMWTTPRDGVEPVHPLSRLPKRQAGRAKAMVASIEARAERGEWGEMPAESAQEPNPAPIPPETPDEPQTTPDDVPAPEDAAATAELVRAHDECWAMKLGQVRERLAELGLSLEGKPDEVRNRLEAELVRLRLGGKDVPAMPKHPMPAPDAFPDSP